MFWKFNLESSGIDTLLAKQDVTLLEILDEEDVLQECKTPNEKLLDFLTKPEIFTELLHLIVDQPSEDVDDTLKYKYMNIACEIIILDIATILDKIANEQEYLDLIWSFTDNVSPLNPLIASFFSKVLTMLLCRKGQQTFEYLKTHDAVNRLIVNIEISAIMELFIKMVTVVEHSDLKMEICTWLNGEKLIEKLIDYLHPKADGQKHYCSAQLLTELVRIGRDSISQYIDSDDPQDNVENPLLVTLEKQETIEKLFSVIFDDVDHPNSDSSIVNGINTILSMIEIRRSTNEGMEELITPMDVERVAQGCHTALEVLATRLSDFHDVLVRPHPTSSVETTYGILDPPLGKVRLSIAGLIASAISTSSYIINESISKSGTVNVLLDLFSRYEWNNFLHLHVQHCICGILNSEVHLPMDETGGEKDTDILLKHLFQECNIVQRFMTLWENNEISQKSGNPRKGYMGHLTILLNELRNAREKGPNAETVQSMFNEFSDDVRQQWTDLVEGSLEEQNKRNICAPMNPWFNPMDSDSEGDDYRPISISQYDGTMQQAFENYQVQPMSNEFIETFGYDENSLQENENIKNPFDEVGKIDFTINANEESENEKLFNNICEQKIRPFDDSSDSDEEDMWEEKELTFTHPSQPRESKNPIRSDSESSSDEEKADSPGTEDMFTNPFADQTKESSEKMEVDSEWTANFDCFDVGAQNCNSDWPTSNSDLAAPLSTNGEDFANFTDICKFEGSTNENTQNEMETENCSKPAVASSYEVKMDEDFPSSCEINLETEKSGDDKSKGIMDTTYASKDNSQSSVQSSSIHFHIDANQSTPDKTQTDSASETSSPESPSEESNIITPASSPSSDAQKEPSEPSTTDTHERTCKNEVKIALNKPLDETNVPASKLAEDESVLLNGPSPEVNVNPSGNLDT